MKFKHKDNLKDQELTHTREIQRYKEAYVTMEQNLKEQLAQSEAMRTIFERVSRRYVFVVY
jgi:hypothetical protein